MHSLINTSKLPNHEDTARRLMSRNNNRKAPGGHVRLLLTNLGLVKTESVGLEFVNKQYRCRNYIVKRTSCVH